MALMMSEREPISSLEIKIVAEREWHRLNFLGTGRKHSTDCATRNSGMRSSLMESEKTNVATTILIRLINGQNLICVGQNTETLISLECNKAHDY